jgi:nucleotide-binding universal stress UspA family protein
MKKSISSIVVAVDGSSPSFRAADYALELASRYGAKLFLITVFYVPASSSQARTAVNWLSDLHMCRSRAANTTETLTIGLFI